MNNKRIRTYLCDERGPNQVRDMLKNIRMKIDIFIDDASHNGAHQVLLAKTALPLLRKDVVYIIEDVKHPEHVSEHLDKYDCEVIECSKRWRDDKLVVVKKC